MNFDCRISSLEEKQKSLDSSIKEVRSSYESAKVFTEKFLGECKRAGITKVSIGMKHKSVPSTLDWPFGHSSSVFAFQPKKAEMSNGGWPPIWGVVARLGIGGGCGNGDQHQADTSNLIDGVYNLRAGNWLKLV
jgi:hypothetical protein